MFLRSIKLSYPIFSRFNSLHPFHVVFRLDRVPWIISAFLNVSATVSSPLGSHADVIVPVLPMNIPDIVEASTTVNGLSVFIPLSGSF